MLKQSDKDAIESLCVAFIAERGHPPRFKDRGAAGILQWFVDLVEELQAHGYGSEFVFTATTSESAYGIILSHAFQGEAKRKSQKNLQTIMAANLRSAIALVQKDERLAKAAREVPEREILPDIPLEINTDEFVAEEPEAREAQKPKEFKSAAEANADLALFNTDDAPQGEYDFDERWSLVLGLKKETK